mmetsp:Transcript_18594/g.46127  ORF Transcript_18594/g.46127 Transcript_18594/m.46127 type:complete len:407 (-) Transcript_18594:103-1323(-)
MIFLCSVATLRNTSLRAGRSSVGFASAFSTPSSSRSTNTQLKASFLEDLTRSFSSMTNGNSSKYYTVGITGASGLIGSAFQNELDVIGSVNGKPVRVVTFQRGSTAEAVDQDSLSDEAFAGTKSITWNPSGNDGAVVDESVLQSLDALVHLSGENISTGQGLLAPLGIRPWTDSKKQEILDSRTITTSALAKAIAASGNKKCDFLVASGVGVYGPDFIGESAAPPATESADVSSTSGFLAEISRVWEAESKAAEQAGNRVVQLRNGVVLSTKGGALAKLYPIFFLGGGGIVGSGEQYFPYVSNRDMARAMVHVLETKSLKGPVNMCAPTPATNADFTGAMGSVLGRPTLLPFPGFAVSLLFGEMGEEVLLGGTRAAPKKLLDSGFKFMHPTVEDAVRSAVKEETKI